MSVERHITGWAVLIGRGVVESLHVTERSALARDAVVNRRRAPGSGTGGFWAGGAESGNPFDAPVIVQPFALLLEDGGDLLLEDGGRLLLE